MDIEKYNHLNSLKNEKNNLINEQSLLNQKSLSRRQARIYAIGLYGTTIISSLLFSNVTLLNVLFPIMFAVSTPIIMKKKNKKKLNELEIEINNLNNQIIEMEKELIKEEKNMRDINKIEEILKRPYPDLVITEQTRQYVINHPELHTECPVRIIMGKFYTDEEYEQRREEVLSRPLPVEEDRPKLVKTEFTKKY